VPKHGPGSRAAPERRDEGVGVAIFEIHALCVDGFDVRFSANCDR